MNDVLFKENLSIIDNISLYKLDALIGKYIFKLDTKIFKYRAASGLFYCKAVYRDTKPASYPRHSYKSFIRISKPWDKSKWQEVKRYSSIPTYALELASELDVPFYLTIHGDKCFITVSKKYQLDGRFAEVVSQASLLTYLDNFNIRLATQPLDRIFQEHSELA